ncbi:uncharacterized protein PRCAT00000380001 [Priceomyces carsonii]|uniref:uncharacterized protein n=1 Tax=Priceomyces carsonii TaxID=28549 RepID=UPI002ED7F979|nr:unnamed protein product [Priceomyces carsonii]
MSRQNGSVILDRVLSFKDDIPFCLILDSLIQSSYYLLQEVAHRCNDRIIYLSYETVNRPAYATSYLECSDKSISDIKLFVHDLIKKKETSNKIIVLVDSLNYIPCDLLPSFISNISHPNITLLGVFHTNCPQARDPLTNYPLAINLLLYFATAYFEMEPILGGKIEEETVENIGTKLQFPATSLLNQNSFKLSLTKKRKSGRSSTYNYILNTATHTHEIYKETQDDVEDEALFKGLTTFNLNTNNKQKLAKEQIELPFMQAQEELGSYGGAIVYQYEKDDDYDEEDPYEDPF